MPDNQARKRTGRRRLWDIGCAGVCMVLRLSFTRAELASLVAAHLCDDCRGNRQDPNWVLSAAHHASHTQNPFSEQANAWLDDLHAEQVKQVENSPCSELADAVLEGPCLATEAPGQLWALLTDPDRDKRCVGDYLLHACFVDGLSGTAAERSVPVPDHVFEAREALESKVAAQAETIDRMLEYISRTRRLEPADRGQLLAANT